MRPDTQSCFYPLLLLLPLIFIGKDCTMRSVRIIYVCAENAPVVAVRNGTPLMAKLAGSGCLQGALAAAFLGALGGKERLVAAVSAAVVLGIAGERAAAKAKAPGTLAAALLDALADLKGADVAKAGKLEIMK